MLDFIPVALKNLFHRPATRNYPTVKRAPYQGTRGHIQIDISACIYCGLCMRRCPTGALKVDRKEKYWSINRFRCIMCGDCTSCCPKKCLSTAEQYTAPASYKSVDIFRVESEQPAPAAPAAPAAMAGAGKETSHA